MFGAKRLTTSGSNRRPAGAPHPPDYAILHKRKSVKYYDQEFNLIFLCYAKEDTEKARQIYNDLTNLGFQIWFDEEKLIGGQNWKVEIKKAIHSCDCFLILLSSSVVSKHGFIQKEIREALDEFEYYPESHPFLIPVLLEACRTDP